MTEGTPDVVPPAADDLARRTRASFGYEWTSFHDWRVSGEANFAQYFGDLNLDLLAEARVLDAGCGMGRHARQLAPHVAHLVAVDFSDAIGQAAANLRPCINSGCVQADVNALPFQDETFDFVYSLGVLHHMPGTAAALRHLVSKVKRGGRVRVYLYWKRQGVSGGVLALLRAARVLTTRVPFPILRAACLALSMALHGLVIIPYRAARGVGIRLPATLPLVTYVSYPFQVLWNDQFDRFSAPLEQRFSEREVCGLLEDAGLTDVRVFPRHGWIGEGIRPS